jgi:hypothetical protein
MSETPTENEAQNVHASSSLDNISPQPLPATSPVLNYTQPLTQSTTSPNNALRKSSSPANQFSYPQNSYPQSTAYLQQNFPQSNTATGFHNYGQFSQTQFPATSASISSTTTTPNLNNYNNSYSQVPNNYNSANAAASGSLSSQSGSIFPNDLTSTQSQLQQTQQQQLQQQHLQQQLQLQQWQLYQQQQQQQHQQQILQTQPKSTLTTEVTPNKSTEKETKPAKEKLTPTQGQKRERPHDSFTRKNGDQEFIPEMKRPKRQGDEESDEAEGMTQEKKEVKSTGEERNNNVEMEDQVEVEVTWPEDAKIAKEKEEGDDGEESKFQQYERVIVGGSTYSVGDTIALWPEQGSKAPAPIGTIKSLYTDGEANNFEICWFYRLEETFLKGSRRHKIGPAEVFLSTHRDENDVESIAKKVTVKLFSDIPVVDEYTKEADHFYYKKKYNHIEKCFEDA